MSIRVRIGYGYWILEIEYGRIKTLSDQIEFEYGRKISVPFTSLNVDVVRGSLHLMVKPGKVIGSFSTSDFVGLIGFGEPTRESRDAT